MLGLVAWLGGLSKKVERETDSVMLVQRNRAGTWFRVLFFIGIVFGLGMLVMWAIGSSPANAQDFGSSTAASTSTLSGWAFVEKIVYAIFAAALAFALIVIMIKWGWRLLSHSVDEMLLVLAKAKARLEWERDNPKSKADGPPKVTPEEAKIATSAMTNLTARVGFVILALVLWALFL